MAGAGKLAEADFRTLLDNGDIAPSDGGTCLAGDDRVFDVVNVSDEADFPDVDLLQPFLDEAAAGVGIVAY